jgi:Protein of unknown function (DUF1588)
MKRISLLLFAAAIAAPACSTGPSGSGGGDDVSTTCGNGVCDPNETATSCPADCTSGSADQFTQALNARVIDYNQALRVAALRLTGALPSMADQATITSAPDAASQQTAYQTLITNYMNTPAFAQEMFYFWRDTFKQGETAILDTAPAFAAEMTVNNESYMNLFTKASGNCPTFDGVQTFTDAECTNGGPKAGVLTNPGVMTQFFSNFAFRRTRWVQEIFDCTAFPAEVSANPTNVGGDAPYTGVWPFESIAGADNGGRVDFHSVIATICADCHSTINHIAPLFAMYDGTGTYQTSIAVPTPLDGAPLAQITDYYPSGQSTAWRYQVPAADIPSLGADMAADPAVAQCGVARLWNFALGKTDIVDTLEVVPPDVIATQVAAFTSNGFKVKDLIYAIFTSDDFVKF